MSSIKPPASGTPLSTPVKPAQNQARATSSTHDLKSPFNTPFTSPNFKRLSLTPRVNISPPVRRFWEHGSSETPLGKRKQIDEFDVSLLSNGPEDVENFEAYVDFHKAQHDIVTKFLDKMVPNPLMNPDDQISKLMDDIDLKAFLAMNPKTFHSLLKLRPKEVQDFACEFLADNVTGIESISTKTDVRVIEFCRALFPKSNKLWPLLAFEATYKLFTKFNSYMNFDGVHYERNFHGHFKEILDEIDDEFGEIGPEDFASQEDLDKYQQTLQNRRSLIQELEAQYRDFLKEAAEKNEPQAEPRTRLQVRLAKKARLTITASVDSSSESFLGNPLPRIPIERPGMSPLYGEKKTIPDYNYEDKPDSFIVLDDGTTVKKRMFGEKTLHKKLNTANKVNPPKPDQGTVADKTQVVKTQVDKTQADKTINDDDDNDDK